MDEFVFIEIPKQLLAQYTNMLEGVFNLGLKEPIRIGYCMPDSEPAVSVSGFLNCRGLRLGSNIKNNAGIRIMLSRAIVLGVIRSLKLKHPQLASIPRKYVMLNIAVKKSSNAADAPAT